MCGVYLSVYVWTVLWYVSVYGVYVTVCIYKYVYVSVLSVCVVFVCVCSVCMYANVVLCVCVRERERERERGEDKLGEERCVANRTTRCNCLQTNTV